MKVNRNYRRGFLIAASAYRRNSDRRLDFSAKSLSEQYEHESMGAPKPDASKNGYTYGKMSLGITLAAMRADHADGLMTKHDLCRGSCAFVRREVRKLPPANYFCYEG